MDWCMNIHYLVYYELNVLMMYELTNDLENAWMNQLGVGIFVNWYPDALLEWYWLEGYWTLL